MGRVLRSRASEAGAMAVRRVLGAVERVHSITTTYHLTAVCQDRRDQELAVQETENLMETFELPNLPWLSAVILPVYILSYIVPTNIRT